MTLTILASTAQSCFYETIRFEESGEYEKETGQWNRERKKREKTTRTSNYCIAIICINTTILFVKNSLQMSLYIFNVMQVRNGHCHCWLHTCLWIGDNIPR
jgi:hypothetical protein